MKIIGKMFAAIFSIAFGIILFAFSLVTFVKSVYTENFYTNIFKNIDLSAIKLSDLGIDLEGTAEDYLVYALTEIGFDSEAAKSIIRNDEIKEVLGEFVSDCVDYATNQEELPQIEKADIDKILNNNEVKEVVKDKIKEEDINKLIDEVNNAIKENIGNINIGDIGNINVGNKGGLEQNAASSIIVK